MITPVVVLAVSWGAMILYWIVSALGVKRDASHTFWWRTWWFRAVLAGILAVWVANRVATNTVTAQFVLLQGEYSLGALAWLGATLAPLGVAYAIWARVYLGSNWSPAPAIKEGHELVTSGPYALVRHPIYTGIILAIFGSGLVDPWWFVVCMIAALVFVRRVFVEEGLMMRQFPNAYPEYKKHTWALVPWVW